MDDTVTELYKFYDGLVDWGVEKDGEDPRKVYVEGKALKHLPEIMNDLLSLDGQTITFPDEFGSTFTAGDRFTPESYETAAFTAVWALASYARAGFTIGEKPMFRLSYWRNPKYHQLLVQCVDDGTLPLSSVVPDDDAVSKNIYAKLKNNE